MNDAFFTPPRDFLAEIPAKDHADLQAIALHHFFLKHEFIFRAGSPGNHVYILRRGRVKIYQLSSVGKEVIQWFCFPGEMFGLAEVSRGGPREVYAQACTDTEVLMVDEHKFKTFLASHSTTATLVIDLLACRLGVLGDMLLNLTVDDVSTRVINLITRLSALYGKKIKQDFYLDIHITHQEIADMIGTSRQTASTVLNQLKRQGVLRIENHCIHIQRSDLFEHMVYSAPLTK